MLDLQCGHVWVRVDIDTLWLFNIAMETCPFIDDFPIKTSIYKGFSMAMLNNQILNRISSIPKLYLFTGNPDFVLSSYPLVISSAAG